MSMDTWVAMKSRVHVDLSHTYTINWEIDYNYIMSQEFLNCYNSITEFTWLIQGGEDELFNKLFLVKWVFIQEKLKWVPYPIAYTKINSIQIKKIKLKALKLTIKTQDDIFMTSDLELCLKPNTKSLSHKRNIGKFDIKIHVKDTTPKSWGTKEEIINWTSLKLKTSTLWKRIKISHRLGENVFKSSIW